MDDQIRKILEVSTFEDDICIQQNYFSMLNKIIDEVLLLKYHDGKKNAGVGSVYKLNELVLYYFDRITSTNKSILLEELRKKLQFFVYEDYSGIKYASLVEELFTLYISNHRSLPPASTISIYNQLLNERQNLFVSKNKKNIIKRMIRKMPLSENKRERLYVRAKMRSIRTSIKREKLSSFGMEMEEMKKLLCDLHIDINSIKPFHKNPLTDEQFNRLDSLFLNNLLNDENIIQIFPTMEKSVIKKLKAKYSRILLPYLDSIKNCNYAIDYDCIQFNYHDLKAFSRKQYRKIVDKLIFLMSEEEKKYLLSHIEDLSELLKLLPLVQLSGILDYFDVESFKCMLFSFDRVKSVLQFDGKIGKSCSVDVILNNLREFLRLSLLYYNADIYTISLLGEDRVEKIIFRNKNTSCNAYDYVNTYIKMLENDVSIIPPLSFDYKIGDTLYKIESGSNYDLDRLLVGKNVEGSCIGPNGFGEDIFYKCLTTKDTDVLLIKNATTGEFCARMILVRLGNSVVMAPIYGKDGLAYDFYNREFLTTLCDKLLEGATLEHDNLEYIFIVQEDELNKENFDVYEDYRMSNFLPHCDVFSYFNVLYSGYQTIDVDHFGVSNGLYNKIRKKIEVKEGNCSEDIMRLRILYLLMSNSNEKLLEEVCKYKRVYLGQDFYIGVLEDDSIDSVVLPVHSARQKSEIDICLSDIVDKFGASENSLDSICLKKVTIHSLIKKHPQM